MKNYFPAQHRAKKHMATTTQIFEGKYLYKEDGRQYSEEDFTVFKEDRAQGNYIFNSEILSRVSTGEFLKIKVRFECAHNFEPVKVMIMRFMGEKKSNETYTIDKNRNVHYTFMDTEQEVHEYRKQIMTRFHIATPTIVTSALMTQAKKVDPVQRTPYLILTSSNLFEYNGPFQEQTIFMESMSVEPVPIKIHRNEFSSHLLHMFQHDKASAIKEAGSPFHLSKHFGMPYLVKMEGNIEIVIDKLKSTDSKYESIFKNG